MELSATSPLGLAARLTNIHDGIEKREAWILFEEPTFYDQDPHRAAEEFARDREPGRTAAHDCEIRLDRLPGR